MGIRPLPLTSELFEERQRLPVAASLAIVAVLGGALVATGSEAWGELLFALGLTAVVLAAIRMRTTVVPGWLDVVIFPVPRKQWRLDDVERCEVVTYRPLLHYGGWGWRWGGGKRGWAYTMRGNRGVLIHLRNGKRFLVGSQRPEELAAAVDAARQARPSGV